MSHIYNDTPISIVLLVTLILDGFMSWATGRAYALTWQGWGKAVVALFGIAAAVRFLHFALFGGDLLSLPAYLGDAAVLQIIGLAGWRVTRVAQLSRQYSWLYVRKGPFLAVYKGEDKFG